FKSLLERVDEYATLRAWYFKLDYILKNLSFLSPETREKTSAEAGPATIWGNITPLEDITVTTQVLPLEDPMDKPREIPAPSLPPPTYCVITDLFRPLAAAVAAIVPCDIICSTPTASKWGQDNTEACIVRDILSCMY
ncbi:hypothetical protein MAR_028015, partial [Mya arenaria]